MTVLRDLRHQQADRLLAHHEVVGLGQLRQRPIPVVAHLADDCSSDTSTRESAASGSVRSSASTMTLSYAPMSSDSNTSRSLVSPSFARTAKWRNRGPNCATAMSTS